MHAWRQDLSFFYLTPRVHGCSSNHDGRGGTAHWPQTEGKGGHVKVTRRVRVVVCGASLLSPLGLWNCLGFDTVLLLLHWLVGAWCVVLVCCLYSCNLWVDSSGTDCLRFRVYVVSRILNLLFCSSSGLSVEYQLKQWFCTCLPSSCSGLDRLGRQLMGSMLHASGSLVAQVLCTFMRLIRLRHLGLGRCGHVTSRPKLGMQLCFTSGSV